MSLTSFLERRDDVRAYLREAFPRTKALRASPVLVPSSVPFASWIGTGFDYLLRWALLAHFPKYADRGTWIAEHVPARLRSRRSRLTRAVEARIGSARRRLTRFRRTRELTDGLCRSAIELAQIDPLFRAGAGAEYVTAPVPRAYVAEVRQLMDIVPLHAFAPQAFGLLNPVFGASKLVRGADADIVIDDMIVEIKTSKHSKVTRDQFNQLLGYYMLSLLGGVVGAPPGHRIRRLAIYQSRYGRLVIWRVRDLGTQKTFTTAAQWFEQRAREAFGWGPTEDWRAA